VTARLRNRAPAGFTLVELMIAIVLSSVFALAIYGFFFNVMDNARTQQSQWMAQQDGRSAVDRMAAEIRQAISPDDGLTPPLISVSATSLEMYVDPSRALTSLRPVPHKVRYAIVSGQLIRERATPTNTVAPFSYGAYGPDEVLVSGIQNGSIPLFAPVTEDGVALPATLAAGAPQLRDVSQLTVRLVIGQRTGAKATTMELNTDVALRNAIHL
jgi:prepilin-type N-terminal cleavage/methylation domain-containing protein